MKSAADILQEASDTYRAKNVIYGDNYKRVGAVMAGLFPAGVTLQSVDDWNRMHILMLKIVKLTRYCVNWKDGHQDSIRDDTVYGGMLEMIDNYNKDGVREIDAQPSRRDLNDLNNKEKFIPMSELKQALERLEINSPHAAEFLRQEFGVPK